MPTGKKPRPTPPFTHLRLVHDARTYRLDQLHQLVSAYWTNDTTVADLADTLRAALDEAKATVKTIVVDQAGHLSFLVMPGGRIALVVPWMTFEPVFEEKEGGG